MSENKFAPYMHSLENFQLLEIVTKKRNDYTPEGLQAAEDELRARNLQPEELKASEAELQKIEELKNEPLTTNEKISFFLFCWRPGTWFSVRLMESEKPRKSREAIAIMRRGLIVWAVVIIFAVWLDLLLD